MRFSLPLALVALATAVTLASAPASAAGCPLGRASYQSKEAPAFAMIFYEISRDKSQNGLKAIIYDTTNSKLFAPRLAELTFTSSLGYAVAYVLGTSAAIETAPGEQPLQSRVMAFEPDFRAANLSSPGAPAPYAIMIPEIGAQLYNATKHDPERQTSIPEGAWILTACR